MISEYEVMEGYSSKDLAENVNEAIEMGYRPYRGMHTAMVPAEDGVYVLTFYQVVVVGYDKPREEEDDDIPY